MEAEGNWICFTPSADEAPQTNAGASLSGYGLGLLRTLTILDQ